MIIRPQFGTIDGIRALLRTGPISMRAAWMQPDEAPATFRPLDDPERLADAVYRTAERARERASYAGHFPPETGRYVHEASGIRSDDITKYLDRVQRWEYARSLGISPVTITQTHLW